MAEVDAGAVAPVVPVAPVSSETPDPSSTAEPGKEAPEGGEQPSKPERTYTESEHQKALQKRLGIESRRLERIAKAEARAEFAERQLEARNTQPATDQPKGKPQPKDYENRPEEFVEALADWKFEQRELARAKESEAQQAKHRARESADAMVQAVMKGAEEFDDFHEVALAEDLPVTEHMAKAIAQSKAPAKALHYLGSHREEAARISRLPDSLQAYEIHTLVSKVTAAPAPTKTPAPIVPNGGNASGSKSMLDMSQEEFEKHRKARLKRK